MDNTKTIEYYNKGQSEIKIKSIDEHEVYHQILKSDKIPKGHKMLLDHKSISLYEWIFNPKYKVYEVFNVNKYDIRLKDIRETSREYKSEKEILEYLHQQIKEK